MNLTKLILAGTMLAAIPSMTLAQQSSPVASQPSARQAPTGMVTTIDRINGTIVIRQTQDGTVGANDGGATEQQFSAAAGLLENVHAGDKVTYAVSESGGKKTITKIDRQ
jgi:acetyl-CoA carboxylase carboxyltransferase component